MAEWSGQVVALSPVEPSPISFPTIQMVELSPYVYKVSDNKLLSIIFIFISPNRQLYCASLFTYIKLRITTSTQIKHRSNHCRLYRLLIDSS